MRVLLDTNVLMRLAHRGDARHNLAADAVAQLERKYSPLHIVPQNIYEFWTAATRAGGENGLNMTVAEAANWVSHFRTLFRLLDDTALVDEFTELMQRYAVVGPKAYDGRLVAAMLTHDLTHLLTFNGPDFRPYQEVVILNPQDVVAGL